MDSARLKQIETIYHAAHDLAAETRQPFLNESCGEDLELRREVESLLQFEDAPSDFLDEPPASLAAEMFAEDSGPISLVKKTIGHYTVIKLLGAGGMGEVYLAEDTKLDRKVALKILPSDFAEDTNRMKRFVREAKSASALNHPNIITIYEINEYGGTHFIATEFIDGKTLTDYKNGNSLDLGSMLEIAIQVASALDEAHSAGIVHRDIKPENVMIRKDGIVKVLDFGLAKPSITGAVATGSAGSDDATQIQFHTQPGLIIGTPNYMSPEQARGKDLDHRTDIFSFGVLLYEMFSGNQPFDGETVSDIIAAVLTRKPRRLRSLPAELEAVILKALQKDRGKRYQDAKTLLHYLKEVKRELEMHERLERSSEPRLVEPRTPVEARTVIIGQATDEVDEKQGSLSSELFRIIGREEELAKIIELIKQPKTRLVTLTGIGGTGKTTLATAIAQRSKADFSDGVFFVELAAIADHELVEQVIAQTLGVKETSEISLKDGLKEFLSERKILLVLDNFEQITKAAAKIGELIADSVNLKIFVTSRVRLNLRFEQEYTLQPLAIPAENDLPADRLREYASVALFVERAKAIRADFALTEENSEAVAAICRQLDGLPLAIELAAVQVKMLAPRAIRKRLENNLQILASGANDLPERQRTMLGAIAWSYDLLEEDEKKLFGRVFVFRGGFTLDSAEAVGNTDADINVFNCVTSLVDKSLLVQSEQFDGEPRLKMLQVVREFARENLEQRNEENEIRHLHAEYFADLAEKAEIGFRGKKSSEWLETIELEHDNYRAALEWTLLNEPETALRITGALPQFWIRRGYLAEGHRWSRQTLETNGDSANPKLLVKGFIGIASLIWKQGNLIEAEQFYAKALKLSREINDKLLIAFSLSGFATIKMLQEDFATALPLLEEGFGIANEVDDKYLAARLANTLGEIFRSKEDYQTAKSYYEKTLSISRQASLKPIIQLACVNLSAVACSLEDYEGSRVYAIESLKLAEEAGDEVGIGFALERFMALAVIEGEPQKGARLYGALENIYELAGYKIEAVDQDFLDGYLDQARAAIGDENYNLAKMAGRAMKSQEAIALALASRSAKESDSAKVTRITHDAVSAMQHSTDDSSSVQTGILSSVERAISPLSRLIGSSPYFRRQRVLLAALVFSIFAAGGYFGYQYFTANTDIKSIAVIPFVNETGNANNEYLSDGLSDSLINSLSQLPQLKVIARSSSFRYKGKEIDIAEIARTLRVQGVVTGRITQQGDNLQISVELINTADNTRIWGEIYDRKVAAALDVPKEIAQGVSETLQLNLTGAQERKMARQITRSPQAYQLHLNGVFFRRKNGVENIRKAIDYQNQALALDPNFTRAYVELSINFGNLIDIGAISPREGLPQARAAAEQALTLDNTLADAYYNVARIRKYEFEWAQAEIAFKRAIELNPNIAAAHTIYAEYLSQLGRFDEALREIKLAQDLDPLRTGLVGNEGSIFYQARMYDEAIIKKQLHVSLAPENPFAHSGLANAYVEKGQYAEAILAYQTSIKLEETTSALIYLGRAYALTGKRVEAFAILDRLKTTEKYVSPAELAILYAALEEKEKAFASLEKAYAGRDTQLTSLKVEPGYDPLRGDPRFQDLMRRLGLTQ